MKLYHSCLLSFTILLLLVASCKEIEIEMYDNANIAVAYKNFDQAPPINLQVDGITYATLKAGETAQKLIPLTGKPVTLKVLKEATGELLLDSVFIPSRENNFTLFITDLLKVAEFYIPPVPVSKDSVRVQLLNNIMIGGVGKKVNFKFFVTTTRQTTAFEELPGIEVKNLEYGKISTSVRVPIMGYPAPAQSSSRGVYVKAYDVETGQLLIDLQTGTQNVYYGSVVKQALVATAGGKQYIIKVNTIETGGVVAYVKPFEIYPM